MNLLRSAFLVLFGAFACSLMGDTSLARSVPGQDCSPANPDIVLAAGDPTEPPPPVVVLRVRVPPAVGAGQELTYHLTVENQSRSAAHHVLLRNALPKHARFVRAQPQPAERDPELIWQFGTLEGGARREVTLVLAADGTGDVQNCARVQFEHGQCVTTKVARPGLRVSKSGPTQTLLYDNLTFQVTITNTGPTEVTNVVLTETLSPGLEHALGNRVRWDVGTIAPGQSRVIEYQAIAKQVGQVRGQTLVTADGGLREETASTLVVAEPKLEVQVKGPAEQYLNTGTPYQIVVRNLGSVNLTNVRVGFQLPAQTTLVSATRGGQMVGSQVQWLLGTLAPNSLRVLDVVVRAQTAGQLRMEALVVADRGLEKRDGVVTTFAGVAALTLDVLATDDPVEVGRATRYRITVRNPGTQAVTQLRVTAELPPELTFVGAAGPPEAKHRQEGGKTVFDAVTIQPRAELRYDVSAKALKPGDVRVQVSLTADQLTAGPVIQRVSTTIYQDVP